MGRKARIGGSGATYQAVATPPRSKPAVVHLDTEHPAVPEEVALEDLGASAWAWEATDDVAGP